MEVHHHSQHPKNWKEYLSEFFMLFLAVFAGFLAESYLDYRTERHKEHDYLVSLVSDLKIDTADISRKEGNMMDVINCGDKISTVFYIDNWSEKYEDSIYLWSEYMFDTEITLQYADGTINQLKNAGGFRLIKSPKITETIKQYMKGQDRIKDQEAGMNIMMQQFLTVRDNIMYARVYDIYGDVLDGKVNIKVQNEKLNAIKAKTGSKFLTNDHREFIKYSNNAVHLIGNIYVYRQIALSQKEKATALIKLIEEEIK